MHVHAGRLFKFIGNAIKHFVTLFFTGVLIRTDCSVGLLDALARRKPCSARKRSVSIKASSP